MGTLTVSSGLAFIYGEIKDNSEAVLFQRRFKAGCGVGYTQSLQSSIATFGSCWCVEWSPTQSSMAVSSSPWRFTCLSGFISSSLVLRPLHYWSRALVLYVFSLLLTQVDCLLAVSLLCSATIPVSVKGRLIRHW